MPEEQWSEAEQWAWQKIRTGGIADFNERDGKELDPKVPGEWNAGRRLGSDFLKEILFLGPYRSAIPVEGVRIAGAWFADLVDLAYGRLNHQLWLERCRFDRAADLTGLRIEGWLSLQRSDFPAGNGADLLSSRRCQDRRDNQHEQRDRGWNANHEQPRREAALAHGHVRCVVQRRRPRWGPDRRPTLHGRRDLCWEADHEQPQGRAAPVNEPSRVREAS